MKLAGNVVVITGSTGSLGYAIAKTLAKEGCYCVCHYNCNSERAGKLVSEIRATGGSADSFKADLTDFRQIKALFDKAQELGTVRVLINSAAVFERSPIEAVDSEQIDRIVKLNFCSYILSSAEFVRRLGKKQDDNQPAGKIVNMSDVGGAHCWSEYSVYCGSKAGIEGVTKSLAKELGGWVCVNAIAPGMITFPKVFDQTEKDRQLKMIPAGRLGRIEEICDAVMFLLGNDYVNGEVVRIDGGRGI